MYPTGFACFWLLISLAAHSDSGNDQDPVIYHPAESPFLYPKALKYSAVAYPWHGETLLGECEKDLEREEAVGNSALLNSHSPD